MEKETLINLINKYLSNQATPEEEARLLSYYDTLQKNKLQWDELEMGNENVTKSELYSKILSEIKNRESVPKKTRRSPPYLWRCGRCDDPRDGSIAQSAYSD